jgi:hypothetical protein
MLTERKPIKTECYDSKPAICLTCGQHVRAAGYAQFFAPNRKGEGGLAVPHMVFLPHGDCPASGQSAAKSNAAAIREKRAKWPL